jgi:hypothetical protein
LGCLDEAWRRCRRGRVVAGSDAAPDGVVIDGEVAAAVNRDLDVVLGGAAACAMPRTKGSLFGALAARDRATRGIVVDMLGGVWRCTRNNEKN